jgi:hypothetical protein
VPLSVLDACWLRLSKTKTYPRRFLFWAPGVSFVAKECDGRQYGAKTHQQRGKKSGNRIEEDEYQVEFHGAVPGAMAYQFVWEALNPDPDPPPGVAVGPYLVTVGPHVDHCTCQAGVCRVECCKHRSGSRKAIREGLVDGAEPWPGIGEADDPDADEWAADAEPGGRHQDAPGERTAPELQAV